MKREWLARITVVMTLAGLPLAALGYQFGLRPLFSSQRVIDIAAAVPETGGFSPDSIQVRAGETVTLRFTSVDVTHGITIGPGLGIDLGQVEPGKIHEVTLTIDHPGTYTFYCTTWCSPNHWRMRGVIEVSNPDGVILSPLSDPVIEQLIAEGENIDAMPTPSQTHIGAGSPSLANGAAAITQLHVPTELYDTSWRRTHTPQQAFTLLRIQNIGAAQSDLVNAVAYLWYSEPPEQTVRLYEQNCAACHGQHGQGDGFAAATTAAKPIAFTDQPYMFNRRDDILYAKIRRGGMGTDMPNFGTLFTPDETWALVDYLRALSLQ
ncbi:MAG: c-type cytochrome [Anaerolineae bacterium]|nr:c-type cytochrome [Anaerolineae bacterium]